jgi:hypothetical protein
MRLDLLDPIVVATARDLHEAEQQDGCGSGAGDYLRYRFPFPSMTTVELRLISAHSRPGASVTDRRSRAE